MRHTRERANVFLQLTDASEDHAAHMSIIVDTDGAISGSNIQPSSRRRSLLLATEPWIIPLESTKWKFLKVIA